MSSPDGLFPLSPVVLTDDEQRECQAMLRMMIQPENGELLIPTNLVDSFKRSVVALCLMSRAERFLILSDSEPNGDERACQAAAKAVGVFPLSVYFYDFGHSREGREVGRGKDDVSRIQEAAWDRDA